MYACVKYLDGNKKNKKAIVSTSVIKNFKEDAHKKILKYQMLEGKSTYTITILLLKESEKELENIVKSRRVGDNPAHLLVSAEEESDKNEKSQLKRSRSVQNAEIEKTECIIKEKLRKLESMKNLKSQKHFGNDEYEQKDIHLLTEDQAKAKDNELKSIQKKELEKSKHVPQVVDVCNVHKVAVCKQKFEKLNFTNESLKKENSSLKAEMKELKSDNSKLKRSKLSLKEKLKEQECELKTVRELNKNLQETIIEKTKEHDAVIENLVSSKHNVSYEDNFPAIATLRTTDDIRRVHISRNVWIPEKDYNSLINSSKTPTQCASNILIKVFDIEDLLKSTITGYESNKN